MLTASLSETTFLTFLVSYIVVRALLPAFKMTLPHPAQYPVATLSDLACMLLSNVTAAHSAGAALLNLTIKVIPDTQTPGAFYPTQSRAASCPTPVPYPAGEEMELRALPLLIDAFMQATKLPLPGAPEKRRKGDLHFLASVFANMTAVRPTIYVRSALLFTQSPCTKTPAGREYFLTPENFHPLEPSAAAPREFPLAKLVAFTEHPDLIRRGGVDSCIKCAVRPSASATPCLTNPRRNCAFSKQAHLAMLSPEAARVAVPPAQLTAPGMDCLPYILLPLAGPEEFDLEVRACAVPLRSCRSHTLIAGPGCAATRAAVPAADENSRAGRRTASTSRRDVAAALHDTLGPRLPAHARRVPGRARAARAGGG
jgi:hypothetical protein